MSVLTFQIPINLIVDSFGCLVVEQDGGGVQRDKQPLEAPLHGMYSTGTLDGMYTLYIPGFILTRRTTSGVWRCLYTVC